MKPARAIWLAAALLVLVLGVALLIATALRSRAPAPRPPAVLTPEQLFVEASHSVVTVLAAEPGGRIVGRGSGVVVERELLVTTCHVIARGKIFLAGYGKKRSRARLVAYDAERDLCALHVPGLEAAPARLGGAGALRVGERVYAIGTPEGFELTLSEGLVSGLREAATGRYIQITAPISEGSSGGGLFDTEGRLVGITAFVYSSGQNLNFAAPADWAAELARKAAAPAGAVLPEVELPASLARRWRHPSLR